MDGGTDGQADRGSDEELEAPQAPLGPRPASSALPGLSYQASPYVQARIKLFLWSGGKTKIVHH